MSDRARVALIFVTIGLLAGGAGFYFFKVYQPAQDLKNAQAEVDAWEVRFQGARECLLGKSPASAKTSESLAIREMTPDPWERKTCTPLMGKLSRGPAPATGLSAVETAWEALDKSASAAALAFARHVSESTTLTHDPLPEALDALDAARRTLRTAAKMAVTDATGTSLPAAQQLKITDGSDQLTDLVIDTIPSAHGMVLFGRTATRTVQLELTAGGTPQVRRVGPGTIRAVPDMAWGATPTSAELRAGTFDAEGVLSAPTMVAMNTPTVAAVAGTMADGVVVFGNQTDLVIARAKAGVITAAPPTKITIAQAGLDVDGRVALVFGDATATKGQILKPGGQDEPVIELPSAVPHPGDMVMFGSTDGDYTPPAERSPFASICLTADRAWTQNAEASFSFGAGRPTFKKAMTEQLQGCTADAAVFRASRNRDTLVLCSDDCRTVKMPSGAPRHATTTVVDGKLVAIAANGSVLGVWREGAKPVFYALPEGATPVLANEWPAMALTNGKVIDVIARGTGSFVVIRIPAA